MMNERPPNIVLITCDQLRHDFIGPASDFMKTPSIDRLAEEGCLFENAYSPNPVCIPARQNLLTGLTARHHGFDDNYFGAAAKASPYYLPTFPQILNDHRYETVAIGKMHFQPERRATGFDFFYNMDEVPPTREEDEYCMFLKDKGYGDLNAIHGVRHCLYMQPQRSLVPEELHGSAWVADRAIEYLDRTRGRRPFLMWAGFIHPHPPLDIPDSWADLYEGQIPPPAKIQGALPQLAEETKQLGCLDAPGALNRMREMYASAISLMDHHLGRILDRLDQLGLTDNTLLIFTSDHGEMLGDLGTYQKFLPYDASSKIPMIMRWPGRVEAGSRRQDFADLNDLLPTFLDAAGIEYPADYDLPGESLLKEPEEKDRTVQYLEHQRGNKRWCSLRNRRFKYVHYYGDRPCLYDLATDPQETVNLLETGLSDEAESAMKMLRNELIRYEARYGLPGHIRDGKFVALPPYQARPFYETTSPDFVKLLLPEERDAMRDIRDEILLAIEKEKTVKLRENHTAEILSQMGYDREFIETLLLRADAQGN